MDYKYILYILLLILAVLITWHLLRNEKFQNPAFASAPCKGVYSKSNHIPGDYDLMSRLPCVPPIDNLPQCKVKHATYQGRTFPVPQAPTSCQPGKVSIYQTGNALNPNSSPVITPAEIDW